MIFPRFHQLRCVRRLEQECRTKGAGTNYLVQHSAGSGKSNSIAWLAYRLLSLYGADGRPAYHAVVVLTDRVVLDRQLQDTIYQLDGSDQKVKKIDKHSRQLAEALEEGAAIIVSTIHKFGFIHNKVSDLPDRRYAVIVDEAHSSTSGEMATNVKEMLADSSLEARLAEEVGSEVNAAGGESGGDEDEPDDDDAYTLEQRVLRRALVRGPQPNISFFAFTATPKHKTLVTFGHRDEAGRPAPFDLYSMRQAIEEGFILDVLRGYTTYRRFFKLAKAVADDPELDKRKAARALARFVDLHPTNIAQKTEVIIEHFRRAVAPQLGGRAKAMVVTASRLQAVKYKLAFDRYIDEHGYGDLRCLVAFSGEVRDPDTPEHPYTEPAMNDGIPESELRNRFAGHEFRVLIVANKYQTGFNQPYLVAMYVDKRLAGIQAVQTLSRLNRKIPGKETTFVLDFVNEREDILGAFQPYYEATTTAEDVDPQRLYELRHELAEARVFTPSEVDGFAAAFYAIPRAELAGGLPKAFHGRLNSWLAPARDRFRELGDTDEEREELQDAFRGRLTAYVNLYAVLSQVVPFQDAELEKLYAFGRMLLKLLPRPEGGGPLDLGDDVVLTNLSLQKQAEGDLRLRAGEGGEVSGPTETGTGAAKAPREHLSTIIEALNQRFGMDLGRPAHEFLAGVSDALVEEEDMRRGAEVNDAANFAHVFDRAFEDRMADHFEEDEELVKRFFGDAEMKRVLTRNLRDEVYRRIRAEGSEAERGADAEGGTGGLRPVPTREVRPFVNAVPVYDLKAAAGRFSAARAVEEVPQHREVARPEDFEWTALPPGLSSGLRPAEGLFAARVIGESMNRRIPNGAWCLWRLHPAGSRRGKVVLARLPDGGDPELGGYTVKIYDSEKEPVPGGDGGGHGGTWRHGRITLSPDSHDPSFEPLVFEEGDAEGLAVVAEMVAVLG